MESIWRIKGREFANCNCSYGCPCQFNALPTHGDCRAAVGFQIEEGHYRDVSLGGIRAAGLYNKLWQSFGVLLPVQSVGVMGDERTYENVLAVRAVESVDAMTADFAHLDHDLLGRISNKVINRVRGINRVVYDISSKPPATIEWE